MGLFTSKAEKEAIERCRQRKIENEQLTAENARLKQELEEALRRSSPEADLLISIEEKIRASKAELLALAEKTHQRSEELQKVEAMLRRVSPGADLLVSIEENIRAGKAELRALGEEIHQRAEELQKLVAECEAKQQALVELDDAVLIQESGLYRPMFSFANSSEYKERLAWVREQQKTMIRGKTAATCSMRWTVSGSEKKGEQMTANNIKQILRSFNLECDNAVDHVKYSNVESMQKKIRQSFEMLNRLNAANAVSICEAYYDLKIQELQLAYEWAVKKQEEKEELRRLKEEEKEAAKVARELEEKRREIEKERSHYSNALQKVEQQIQGATGEALEALEEKRREIAEEMEDLDLALRDVDYREANVRAGYVYIISNIGSFGEGVYKIGMTRRLDPMERVAELGDASVPFGFDVHALIFSEDAPALEAALHRTFDGQKVNKINTRREFFKVSLDDIEQCVKENHDKTVDFVRVPEAAQYRMSQRIAEGV